MLGQSSRSQKAPTGFGASSSVGAASDFHVVRLQEMERTRAIKEMGIEEDRRQVPPSYFVPSLQAICADNLAQNFATTPEIDSLQGEHAALYEMIVERLPVAALPEEVEKCASGSAIPPQSSTSSPVQRTGAPGRTESSPSPSAAGGLLPLKVAVSRVVSETYWKRCCMARWSSGQLSKFTGGGKPLLEKQYGWKRLFLEHVLSDFLMSLRSSHHNGGGGGGGGGDDGTQPSRAGTNWAGVGVVGNPRGRTHSLGAPAFLASFGSGGAASGEAMSAGGGSEEGDVGEGDASGFYPPRLSDKDARALAELCAVCRDYVRTVELPCQYIHLNWYEHLFSRLPGVLSFRLTYGTTSVGVGFSKGMLGFTNADAESVRHTLHRCTSLETLRLPQNNLNSAQMKMVCAGLVGNTRLRVLDLSRNAMDDTAVTEGIAVLLCQPEFPLEELNLSDNKIAAAGATALADALTVNRTLTVLNLGQNCIDDAEGGPALMRALRQNPHGPLRELNLSNNRLAGETVAALGQVLPELRALAALNLAGNRRIGSPTEDGGGAAAGNTLCEAVLRNTSLHFLDVRFCNLTTEQVCTVEAAVQGRVASVAGLERAAKEAEQRSRIASIVANRPSGRC